MEKLNKILASSLAKKGLSGITKGAEICFYAEKWGKGRFKAISFSNGILKLSVESSSAASELHLSQESLIDYLNGKAQKRVVKSLRIINYK